MNRLITYALIFLLIGYIASSLFGFAYAVDNNCQIAVKHILQQTIINGCFEQRIDTLENAPAGGESTICGNQGSGVTVHISATNCDAKGIQGSSDISVTSSSNTITIDYNGTSGGESTVCGNVGTGNPIHKTGTNCSAFSLIAGNDITITNTTDDYTIASTATEESTVCANVGTGTGIFKDGNCNFKSIIIPSGSPLTIASGTNDITLDSTRIFQQQKTVFQSATKTNIGTSYVDVYTTTFSQEEAMNIYIHCDGVKEFTGFFNYDYVGTGTHSIRVVDQANNANLLFERTDITADTSASGFNNVGGNPIYAKPAWCTTGFFKVELQAKSTVGTDDPVIWGYTIWSR